MIFTRVILCIIMMLFTACGVCSTLFPLMRKNETNALGQAVKNEVSFWYNEIKRSEGITHTYQRVYLRHNTCSEFRTASVAGAALNIAGCGFGAIVSIIAAVHVCAHVKFHICCTLMVLLFITFALFTASLATVVYTYRGTSCVNDNTKIMKSYHSQEYKLVEGFILLCVATGGFFITIFLEICS